MDGQKYIDQLIIELMADETWELVDIGKQWLYYDLNWTLLYM